MPRIHCIKLEQFPIYQQLQLEEALLRADDRNWCLVNEGSPPAIVVGISGKPHELIQPHILQQAHVPVWRRFSGGGTVIVDQHTTFVTFIINCEAIQVSCCPQKILRWTESIHRPAVGHEDFSVRENDYVIGNRKCGGNAQYMRKGRWLHHSSFLWDYDPEKMNYLLLPKKTPHYRQQRCHSDFLCKVGDFVPSKSHWIQRIIEEVGKHFEVEEVALDQAKEIMQRPHRKTTQQLTF